MESILPLVLISSGSYMYLCAYITYLQLTPFLLAGAADAVVLPLAPSLVPLFKLEGNATHFIDG